MFRTRFKKEIVAEFLPPARARKKQNVIILLDGMPSIPRKKALMEFLSQKGYWVFYTRYRGAWESGGEMLAKSPVQDVLDVARALPKGVTESAFGQHFALTPERIFVIGGSFGGCASILASADSRIAKVVACCPVVDWAVLESEREKETSNPDYAAYLREAWGNAYRLSSRNWKKLGRGEFFNPSRHADELTPSKILIFHAKDDPYIPWQDVRRFANEVGIPLKMLARGGHLSTELVVQQHWAEISRFLTR